MWPSFWEMRVLPLFVIIQLLNIRHRTAMKLDTCKLCLNKQPLVESHLMSCGLYDLCKTPDDDPIFVSSDVILQSGRQLKYPLLCAQCDGMLSHEGENWVLPLLARFDGAFPFFNLLQKVAPDVKDGDMMAYATSRTPEIDSHKLVHFAMGIFWKASVHSWRGSETAPLIDLGKYGEPLRVFLRGVAQFPEKMSLVVGVVPPPIKTINFCCPYRGSASGYHNYLFHIPGIEFALHVGNTITREIKATCFASNPLHPIFVSAGISSAIKGVVQEATKNARLAKNVRRYLGRG
jgi:hypothetical protein